ncbi:MAG: methionyl-tRNA formyltransferase [Eubacterium sp.]|nr:methionyl-tRNA formyltransferase [Eubacterium sp.]
MKIIFMGTPDFAVETFESLIKAGHEIVLAVTQPDRPKGRGGHMAISAVKEAALKEGIEVFQPVKIRESENIEFLRKYDADIIVVVAFGQILPKEILDMPKYGCINVHASLLPKYRGASPIQWAVINGDKVSGVTIMKMGVGLDDGDIILQREIELCKDETGGSLFDRLSKVGAELCLEALAKIEDKSAVFTPQDESKATKVGIIKKQLGEIDFSGEAYKTECLIRGLNPWPSAFTHLSGKILKIWKAEVTDDEGKAGCVIKKDKTSLTVACGKGALKITELQIEGKKRMSAEEFLRGAHINEGDFLG